MNELQNVIKLLPGLSEIEYQSLKEDIKINGIKYPIILNQKGIIIDGNHRQKICDELGIELPEKIIEYKNERDAINDSFALNIKRRQLTSEQLKSIAKELNKLKWTQEEIAKVIGVKQKTISNWLPSSKTNSKITNNPKDSPIDCRIKLNKEQKERIYHELKSGKTQQKIANNYKVDQTTISKINNQFKKKEEKQKEREKLLKSIKENEYKPQVKKGRFQDVCNEFEDNFFDHIITDPPYPKEYLNEWSDLSKIASRILKPGGFCICYSGKLHLPEVIQRLSKHLNYYWQLILIHKSVPSAVHPVKINTMYKPILVFQKSPHKPQENYITDLIQGTGSEKFSHEWQQGEEELTQILERFTHEGDLILDPFAGSGTTGIACQKNKRRSILIDKNKIG